MQPQEKETLKYRMMAHIAQLHLNKSINFETKVTWKRNVNKAETEIVTHQDCLSTFNQTLQLDLNMVFNRQQNKFQSKLTEFSIVVIYKGKIKSGGFVKYDAAEIVNNNYTDHSVKLNLQQCPDPNAYLEIVFNYEVIGDSSRTLFNQLSMLNPSGFQQDLSQIDFRQDEEVSNADETNQYKRRQSQKQNLNDLPFKNREISKINNILDKFESISKRIKPNHKSLFQDQNSTKNESLQISSIPTEQEQRLRVRVYELQNQLQLKNALIQDYERKIEDANRGVQQLELKLELSESKYAELQEKLSNRKFDAAIIENQSKFKNLYEKTLSQLEEIRNNLGSDMNFSKQNNNFNRLLEEVRQVDEIPEFEHDRQNGKVNELNQTIEELQRQNVQMQTKIASISHNIAQLFNAAYDYGGAKLLDFLQSSIGLIQQDS